MELSTRRRFLRVGGVVGALGLAGCSGISGDNDSTPTPANQDTDGDGVIDSQDYAPRDASVQRAEQVKEVDSTPTEAGKATPAKTATPVERSLNANGGLAYHDGRAYSVDSGSIYAFDMSSGEVTNSFAVPAESRPRGLAFGDGSLWFADRIGPDYDGSVAELNPETGEIRSTVESSWDPRGLAFGEGSLWVVDITANRIIEYDTEGNVLSSFDTDGVTWGLGLAYFDGSLWLGNNCGNDGCTVSLREYSTDGELLRETGERTEAAYGGLATTDSELLGPGGDGTLTVLRTL